MEIDLHKQSFTTSPSNPIPLVQLDNLPHHNITLNDTSFTNSSTNTRHDPNLTFPLAISPSKLISCQHEEEIITLRKQLRQQEIQAIKERAVLEQKIEILENRLQEARQREENINKMNETILSAINDMNNNANHPSKKTIRELELATEQHNKEMSEYRTRTSEIIRNLESENKILKDKLSEADFSMKEDKLNLEKLQIEVQKKTSEYQNEISRLEKKLKNNEEDKIKQKEFYEHEMQVKVNELNMKLDKLKEDHITELQKLQNDSEKSLLEMKELYQKEKKILESRIEKLQESLDNEPIMISTRSTKDQYEKEINDLTLQINDFRAKSNLEILDLIKQRDEAKQHANQAIQRAEQAELKLKKLKSTMNSKQALRELTNGINVPHQKNNRPTISVNRVDNNGMLIEANKMYKQKVIELKNHIKKLEETEKELKERISEKDEQADSEPLNKTFESNATKTNWLELSHIDTNHEIQNKTSNRTLDDDPYIPNTQIYESHGKIILHSVKPSLNNDKQLFKDVQLDQENHHHYHHHHHHHHYPQVLENNNSRTSSKSPLNNTQFNTNTHHQFSSAKKVKDHNLNESKVIQQHELRTKHENLMDYHSNNTNENYPNSAYTSSKKSPQRCIKTQENLYVDTVDNQTHYYYCTENDRNQIEPQSCVKASTTNLKQAKFFQKTPAEKDYQHLMPHQEHQHEGFNQQHDVIGSNQVLQGNYCSKSSNVHTGDLTYCPFGEDTKSQTKSPYNNNHDRSTHKTPNIHSAYTTSDNNYTSNIFSTPKSYNIDKNLTELTPNHIDKSHKKSSSKKSANDPLIKFHIQEKLKDLEYKLRDVEIRNKGLKVEKGKVELELEKLLIDLRERNNNGELKSEEDIMFLKNEIKLLLGVVIEKSKNQPTAGPHPKTPSSQTTTTPGLNTTITPGLNINPTPGPHTTMTSGLHTTMTPGLHTATIPSLHIPTTPGTHITRTPGPRATMTPSSHITKTPGPHITKTPELRIKTLGSYTKPRLDTTALGYSNDQNDVSGCLSSISRSKNNSSMLSDNYRGVQGKSNREYMHTTPNNYANESIASPLLSDMMSQRSMNMLDQEESSRVMSQYQSLQQGDANRYQHQQQQQQHQKQKQNYPPANENYMNYKRDTHTPKDGAKLCEIMRKRSNNMRECMTTKISQSFQDYNPNNLSNISISTTAILNTVHYNNNNNNNNNTNTNNIHYSQSPNNGQSPYIQPYGTRYTVQVNGLPYGLNK